MYTLIGTAKLNDLDPQAWLADVLARIANLPPVAAPRAPALGVAARRRGHRGMTTRPAITRLKVTLEDVEPAVMRRLDVPLTIRLDRLHLVLQAAMGETNSHLYEFRAGGTAGASPIPTSTMGHCRQRRRRSSTSSRIPAPGRFIISTTLATAGNTPLGSSASASPTRRLPIRSSSPQRAAPRPRTWAGPGAMPNSSPRSPI
jgi:hypothetical protein